MRLEVVPSTPQKAYHTLKTLKHELKHVENEELGSLKAEGSLGNGSKLTDLEKWSIMVGMMI